MYLIQIGHTYTYTLTCMCSSYYLLVYSFVQITYNFD